MHRALKGVLWAVVGLVVAVVAAFAWGRLRPPTQEQAKALAVLEADSKPPQGRNAYPWLWFADFDVPADQLDAAYAKDHQRVLAWESNFKLGAGTTDPVPNPQADFPALAKISQVDRELLCKPREADCLGKVRAHRDDVNQVLTRYQPRLARDEALSGFDYAWTDMPMDPVMPMPSFGASMGLWHTSIAANFLDGHTSQAMDAACTQVATMRRLHAHSNTLVSTLIFAARLRGAVQLFVQLLAALPVDEALPASCAAAFVPVTDADIDLCPSIRSEFALVASPQLFGKQEHWYDNLSLNAKATQRMLAPRYGALCDASLPQRLLSDERFALATAPPGFDIFDLVSNSAGTILSHIPGPAFDPYLARQQDVAASLRMGALMLWLRETRDRNLSLQQRLAARPAWMHFAADRHVDLTDDGKSLTMNLREQQESNPWPTIWPLAPGV
jgi:hypothetical protein